MAKIRLTKTELRSQQLRLNQLKRYLPTLRLKKALLQMEVNNAEQELETQLARFEKIKKRVHKFSPLLSDTEAEDLFASTTIVEVEKSYENIAGIEIPTFEKALFAKCSYSLYDSPMWLDFAVDEIKELISQKKNIEVIREKKQSLEYELREVSIRVNLFEKIMIPRCETNIKKIKIYLSDLQLSAVAQAKVSKTKIEERKKESVA